jgi:uncharacterized membrane protein YqjE
MVLSKAVMGLMQTRLQLLKIDLLASQRKLMQQSLAAIGLLMATFFLLWSLFITLLLVLPASYRVYFLLSIALLCVIIMVFSYRKMRAHCIRSSDFSDSLIAAVDDLQLLQSAALRPSGTVSSEPDKP